MHLLLHYDPFHIIQSVPLSFSHLYLLVCFFNSLPLFFSLRHSFPSLLSYIFFTISLQSFSRVSIQFVQFFYSVSASSALSLINFEAAFFALFLMLLYLLLFSSVFFRQISLFESFVLEAASVTCLFHH